MNDVSSVARSGMDAFTTKLEVTANNVANVNSDNFTASRVTMQERGNGGVDTTIAKTGDKVDISREAVEMLSTVSGFKANLQMAKVEKEMSKSMLDIIT